MKRLIVAAVVLVSFALGFAAGYGTGTFVELTRPDLAEARKMLLDAGIEPDWLPE